MKARGGRAVGLGPWAAAKNCGVHADWKGAAGAARPPPQMWSEAAGGVASGRAGVVVEVVPWRLVVVSFSLVPTGGPRRFWREMEDGQGADARFHPHPRVPESWF